MKMINFPILIIDDEAAIRTLIKRYFYRQYKVFEAASAKEAINIIANSYVRLILLDLGLPDADGLDLLLDLKESAPDCEIIVITNNSSVESGVEAMKRGAIDYIVKPFNPQIINQRVAELVENSQLNRKLEAYHRSAEENAYTFIGESPKMQQLMQAVAKIAPSDVSIIINGESGTGKEVVARAIHKMSSAANNPFVAINCGAIPETLIESELFGHERGSFTSAIERRKGWFELADGGTVFLDEICSMPLIAQVKLLRFLDQKNFFRVGGSVAIPVNVRVVAASNRSLEDEIKAGRFRQDLYYRLNGFNITIPPLRDRGIDIELLANYYLKVFAKQYGRKAERFSDGTLKKIKNYQWPGNVRELQNVVQRLVLFSEGKIVHAISLETQKENKPSDEYSPELDETSPDLKSIVKKFRRNYVIETKKRCNDNVSKTAEFLGVHRNTITQILQEQDNK